MDAIFDYGQKVRVIKNIRNDGTFMGKNRGELLIRRGSLGYITGVGKFLQDQVIYQVHFIEQGCTVGCRESELGNLHIHWVDRLFERGDRVIAQQSLSSAGEIVVRIGETGTILGLKDESKPLCYRVSFNQDTELDFTSWLIPESALKLAAALADTGREKC
jgi:nitrogen fixation protein NifZ